MSFNSETTFYLLRLIVTLIANCIDKSSFIFSFRNIWYGDSFISMGFIKMKKSHKLPYCV